MCSLSQQKYLALAVPAGDSRQKISSLSESHLALKKKNDARAFAMLRALAKYQIAPSASLSAYPTLAKYLERNKS